MCCIFRQEKKFMGKSIKKKRLSDRHHGHFYKN